MHVDYKFEEKANGWNNGGNSSPGNGTGGVTITYTDAVSHTHSCSSKGVHSHNSVNMGASESHNNMPPYLVLAYIIRVQ